MLFYASLFVFCLVLSAVVLWLYRSLTDVTNTVYRSILPSSKENVRHQERVNPGHSRDPSKTPRGWLGNQGHAAVRANPAVDKWTKKSERVGIAKFIRDNSPEPDISGKKQAVGWPYRVESFEVGGRYKVAHERRRKKTHLREVPRPWGW